MCRVQMLDHDEGHAGCRKGAEEFDQRFEPARRGADSHDGVWQVVADFWHRQSMPVLISDVCQTRGC